MMNRLLAYLVAWGIFLFVFILVVEGGLRLLGLSPQPTINAFHPALGWVKKADTVSRRTTSEFDVTYTINHLGLRGGEGLTLEKPVGTARILMLGDSFTLGYTVDRADLFVDLLANKYLEERRSIEVINGGTEGYSSDQELLWLRQEGLKFDPDYVIMNFYQNDVFWNSQDRYLRFPKPLFPAEGAAEQPIRPQLEDPGEQSWFAASTAVGKLIENLGTTLPMLELPDGQRIPMEWGVILKEEPAEIQQAWKHTRAVLIGFKSTCEARGIKPILALIPAKAQIYPKFESRQGRQLGLPDGAWSPNLPFERVRAICTEIGLDVMDPSQLFLREALKKVQLYYNKDRHFSPAGNRAYAQALYDHLKQNQYLGEFKGAATPVAPGSGRGSEVTEPIEAGLPVWLVAVLGLWVVLGSMYAYSYRDENGILGFLKVGALIWVVVGLIALFRLLAYLLPAGAGGLILAVVLLAILVFLFWKLRKRLGIILELYVAFTHRGHWYMMPLLAVMLAIGSLLIVAASSPFVAPFIYTLF